MYNSKDDTSRNGSGYPDPTAHEAIKKLDKEEARCRKLLDTIFNLCELSGVHLEERIVVRDTTTGKIWR